VNEVSIELGSTAYLQAEPGGEMAVSVVDGGASVSAQGVTIETPAGSQTTIPLDEDGLADGPPTDPQPYDGVLLESLPVLLLTEEIAIAPPIEDDVSSGDVPELIDGQWEFGLASLEGCEGIPFEIGQSNTSTIDWSYEGGNLTGTSEGDPLTLAQVEPDTYEGIIEGATFRMQITSSSTVVYTVELPDCTLFYEGQLLD
jgi:hypothetical protein